MTSRAQIHSQSHHPIGVDGSRHVHPENRPPLTDFVTFNAPNVPHVNSVSVGGTLSPHEFLLPWGATEPTTTIHGGTFIGGNVNNVTGETGIDILHRAVVLDAMHDSAQRYPQPRCHPETRKDMLDNLWNWATKSVWEFRRQPWEYSRTVDASPVVWLYGPAGAGKSAIMRTLSERLTDAELLGGSFFFKRGHQTRGNAEKLFATLSYQLAHNIRNLKGPISKIVEDAPYLVAKSMNMQLQKLVLDPCSSLNPAQAPTIIIDGLDECEGHQAQQELLYLIANAIRKRSLQLRFLITSRPEPHIRETFMASLFKGLHHTYNVEQDQVDVRKYLRSEFARIHREHKQTMASVLGPWPSQEVIEHLAWKSSGYFIYASTVIKFVDDRNFRPTERLKALEVATHLESPFSTLDQLYTQILSTVPARHRLLPILRALEFFQFCLPTSGIEQLLELEPRDVQLILWNLHSVLVVPNDRDRSIRVHHESFRDFLNDQQRSGKFYVGGLQHQVELGKSILKAFSYTGNNRATNLARPVAFDYRLEEVISKIPPTAEMIPLIRLFNPVFSFNYITSPIPEQILSLLENIGNPPEDLVQLLEDCQFMATLEYTILRELKSPPTIDNHSGLSADGFLLLSQCALLPCILQVYILGYYPSGETECLLSDIHILLDISWVDLRAAMCPLRHMVGCANPEGVRRLLWFVAKHLSTKATITQLSLELAQGCVRLIKKGQHWKLPVPWGYFIRMSPHSSELLHDICTVSFDPAALKELENSAENYHSTLQWLKVGISGTSTGCDRGLGAISQSCKPAI
ncbi:hypothetical protein C8J57DRAFT_670145 [Mycena rebaudengoi]|nr:hypothetical protein C8J57DRAFT_670145 [Mycena rebaudengoi]